MNLRKLWPTRWQNNLFARRVLAPLTQIQQLMLFCPIYQISVYSDVIQTSRLLPSSLSTSLSSFLCLSFHVHILLCIEPSNSVTSQYIFHGKPLLNTHCTFLVDKGKWLKKKITKKRKWLKEGKVLWSVTEKHVGKVHVLSFFLLFGVFHMAWLSMLSV